MIDLNKIHFQFSLKSIFTYTGHPLFEYVLPEEYEECSESSQNESKCAHDTWLCAPLLHVHCVSLCPLGSGDDNTDHQPATLQ